MCYSAQIKAEYKKFVRAWGAVMSIKDFHRVYWERAQGAKIKIPKAIDVMFAQPETAEERAIAELIGEFNANEAQRLEQELFKQRKRLADAERTLQTKTTKKALDDKRISTDKVQWCLDKLAGLRRVDLVPDDMRIFPGWYAPVVVMENGQRVVKPMRYQCRLPGSLPSFDRQYPGCYNARRDNLEGFWRKAFGASHGILVATAFFENVSRHTMEGRALAPDEKEQNVILEFRPQPEQDMLVACLYSHWTGAGEADLDSFAAITDDPPPEVAAAGHDRCIIPVKSENVDAWLSPNGSELQKQYAILDDRARPYYEHRLAA
jgi:putative SOS response-associated peptidase YedK